MENQCKNIADFEVENFGVKLKMCSMHKDLTLTIIKPKNISVIKRPHNHQCEVKK